MTCQHSGHVDQAVPIFLEKCQIRNKQLFIGISTHIHLSSLVIFGVEMIATCVCIAAAQEYRKTCLKKKWLFMS